MGKPLRDLSPYSIPTPCARAARQVLDMIEHGFAKRGINLTTLPARLLYRSAYVVLISFVACTIPFFGVRGGHPPARLACAGHVQSWDAHGPPAFCSPLSSLWLRCGCEELPVQLCVCLVALVSTPRQCVEAPLGAKLAV